MKIPKWFGHLTCAALYTRSRYKRTPAALGGGRTFEKQVSQDGILDADLLNRFQWLPRSQQESLAAKAGVQRQQLLLHIRDMILAVSRF